MSIASEITRINNNIANAYDECETKGATMPQYENSANLASTIASIPSGGGDLSEYFNMEVTQNTNNNFNCCHTIVKKIPNTLNIASNVTSLSYAFSGWKFHETELPTMDLSNITNCSYMFNNAQIDNLDLTKLQNTGNIKGMDYMFQYAKAKQVTFPQHFDTSKATTFYCMFSYFDLNGGEGNLDVSGFILPSGNTVPSLAQMFSNTNVNVVNASGIITSKHTGAASMFAGCKANEIILSNCDTSNFTLYNTMFNALTRLKHLDLSMFTTKQSGNITIPSMFANSKKVATLDVSNFEFSKTSSFSNAFQNFGVECLQSDGAYADGIPYVYVKNATEQNWVLTATNGHPSTWSTNNVVIKSN